MPIRVSCCKTSDCIGWTQFQDSSCTRYVTTTILIISSISLRYLDSFQCYNVCSVCEEGEMEKFSPKQSSLNIKQFCSIFFKMEIYILSIYRTLLLKMSKYVVIRVESKRWATGIYLTNKTKKNGIQILCWSSFRKGKVCAWIWNWAHFINFTPTDSLQLVCMVHLSQTNFICLNTKDNSTRFHTPGSKWIGIGKSLWGSILGSLLIKSSGTYWLSLKFSNLKYSWST